MTQLHIIWESFIIHQTNLINELFMYSILALDTEFLKKIISKTDSKDLFTPPTSNYMLIGTVIHSELICEIILTQMHLEISTVEFFLLACMRTSNINLIKKFLDRGYKMSSKIISICIKRTYINVIKIAFEYDYPIQQIFDQCIFDCDCEDNYDIQMLKFLVESGIDISKQIANIFIYAAGSGKLDLVVYCHTSCYECDIDSALVISCEHMHLDIIKYLLQNGASVTSINMSSLRCENIEIIRLLIDNGLCLNLDIIFSECFIYATDISDIIYLIEYGADPNAIFDIDKYRENNPGGMGMMGYVKPSLYYMLNSYLEFIVSKNYLSHLKYLVEINFDRLKLELDRLFIIGCSNGCIDMVIYLLELGADLHAQNDLAFTSGCYFGHLGIVKLLLERDQMKSKENLFELILSGDNENNYNHKPIGYHKLINGNNIFRNDIYQWGSFHLDILKLLHSHDMMTVNYTIFETLPSKYYVKDFFTWIISIHIDINQTFCISDTFGSMRNRKKLKLSSGPTSVLELSIYLNALDIVKLLLDNGADIKINNGGPMQIAELINNTDIVKLLLEYGG